MDNTRSARQEPTASFILPYEETEGQTAIDLYELSGREALPWQKALVYDILAKNESGKWAHLKYGYEVPRQNGKGEILIMRELYGLAAGEHILHTAHLTSTSHKAWERLCNALDQMGVPYYSIKAKGQEIIEITEGGKVEFRTRTAKGGLGESYDLLVIDEAQEYKIEQESALQYIISASYNPQTIMCGTPPTPISAGTVFKSYRSDVLSGSQQNSGWAEWSVEEFSDVNDVDLWYRTNPSLELTGLDEVSIRGEVSSDPDKIVDFNIQRLGLWIKYNQQSAILKSEWDATRAEKLPKLKGKMNVGIKYHKDGESVSMAVALKTESERIFIEVIDSREVKTGNGWIIEFLARANKSVNKIVIDGAGAQKILEDELKKAKIKGIVLPKVADIIKANALFEKSINDKTLQHMEQPALDHVVTNCEKRAIGTQGGFGYKAIAADDDVSLMDAVILAAWAAQEFKEPKKQKISY